MPLPAIVIFSFWGLILLGAVAIVLHSVRRKRQGDDRITRQGWRRLPDGSDVMAGWDGWPFLIALKPGRLNDIVVGEVEGVEFMSLRWSQHESGRGDRGTDIERYNMIALRCESRVPPLSVIRGEHKIKKWERHELAQDFEVGDRRFDRRWQTLGDAEAGRALLVPAVQQAMEDIEIGAWVFQPGWVVRVVKWTFWAGDDVMLEEVHRAAAPWRHVPADAWAAYGGQPRFATVLGEGPATDESPTTGPGRGWD